MEHDILKEFLEKNASEVMNMLLTEWNIDDYGEVQREEAMEEGLEKGISNTIFVIRGLQNNLTVEQIAKKYDLSVSDIEKIKSKI